MHQFGEWASYAGPRPGIMGRPGRGVVMAAYLAWIAAMAAWLVCVAIFFHQYTRDYHVSFAQAPAANPVAPFTFLAAVVVFLIIMGRRSPGVGTRLAGGAVGVVAGLSFFEFPYQLIVWNRLSPPVPPDPALYRALVWVPLLLIEITTLLLLRLSPMVRLTRATLFTLALMMTVFAAWGLSGFGHPSAPLPTTLNIAAKLLSFAAAATLFVRPSPETASTAPVPATPPQAAAG